MCEQLDQEIAEGRRLAKELVEHILRMGSAGARIPILIADESYVVSVKHIPVTPEPI